MPPIWVDFWSQNFLNKGPFFGRFFLTMSGYSGNRHKIVKTDSFPLKFIIKVDMMSSIGNKKRKAYWKPGGRLPSICKSCTPSPGRGAAVIIEVAKQKLIW